MLAAWAGGFRRSGAGGCPVYYAGRMGGRGFRRSGNQRFGAGSRPASRRWRVVGDWEDWEDWEDWVSNIPSQNSQSSQNSQISKTVVFNDTPKPRNGCPKWFWCSAGPGIGTSLAERERYTEDIVLSRGSICPKCCLKILSEVESIMLNDTPKCRSSYEK